MTSPHAHGQPHAHFSTNQKEPTRTPHQSPHQLGASTRDFKRETSHAHFAANQREPTREPNQLGGAAFPHPLPRQPSNLKRADSVNMDNWREMSEKRDPSRVKPAAASQPKRRSSIGFTERPPPMLQKRKTMAALARASFDLDYDASEALTYEEAQRIDVHRHELLLAARRLNPTTLALRLQMLRHSVMPRVLRNPILWVIVITFIIAAICSYNMDLGQDVRGASLLAPRPHPGTPSRDHPLRPKVKDDDDVYSSALALKVNYADVRRHRRNGKVRPPNPPSRPPVLLPARARRTSRFRSSHHRLCTSSTRPTRSLRFTWCVGHRLSTPRSVQGPEGPRHA